METTLSTALLQLSRIDKPDRLAKREQSEMEKLEEFLTEEINRKTKW